MKNLFGAILMALIATAIAWFVRSEYAEVTDLHQNGQDGNLFVQAETGKSRSSGRRSREITSYYYDGTLAGVPVQLRTTHHWSPRQTLPVVFSAEKLRDYSSQTKRRLSADKVSRYFTAYRIGGKSDSTWHVFVSDFGGLQLWGLAGLEAVCLFGAWVFWNSFTHPDARARKGVKR